MSDLTVTIVVGTAVIFYLLPTLIAETRNCLHGGAIIAVNLLFGWTVLGWIAALIWAIVETPRVYKRA